MGRDASEDKCLSLMTAAGSPDRRNRSFIYVVAARSLRSQEYFYEKKICLTIFSRDTRYH